MIPADYVWFTWASAFLVPWAALYWRFPLHRPAMRWASLFTMPFGLTEPLFVPEYWSPPSLLDLASRTGFDVESLIFSFAIGGVAAVLVNLATGRALQEMPEEERHHRDHRWHRIAVVAPFLLFPVLLPLGWNPIYPGILAMAAGAAMTYWCRRDLGGTIAMGATLFVGYYTVFLVGLHYTAPEGYIREVRRSAPTGPRSISTSPGHVPRIAMREEHHDVAARELVLADRRDQHGIAAPAGSRPSRGPRPPRLQPGGLIP